MRRKATVLLFIIALALQGCASYRYTRRAAEAARTENWDSAVYYYLEALAQDPGNIRFKMELQRARLKAADQHFRQGMRFKEGGNLQRARAELELAVQLDGTHQLAEVELRKVRKDLEVLSQQGGAAKLEAMKKAAAEMKVKPPMLNPASQEPMSLNFPNPVNVRDIYKAIGQAFGINILFDPKLRDNKLAIELKDVTARQALETVMQAAGHFYKVLDEKSVIVVEDTPQNRRDYEDLVVKTFFLSNADVKDVVNMLRQLIDARRIATDERLNSIVIRDTADKVAIAERLISANDKSRAEVLIDVELIQVDSNKIRDIGASLSSYSFPFGLNNTDPTKGVIKALPDLGSITRSMWSTVVPNVTVNLIKSAGEAETLAQPQLRILEGEKANLIIGDRVPIPTTTFNTSTTIGTSVVPITSFQYQDVGIKIDVEPRVHHNNEVTMKLDVEVSELGDNVTIAGQTQPKIGTRTIKSVIRLKDGETSLLAGLFRYNKRTDQSGIPWLSDLPVIGGLFRATHHEFKKTDLLLTLTPHIIRNPDITEEDLAPVWVGTENRITIFGNSPRLRSASQGGPFGDYGGVRIADDRDIDQPQPVEPEPPAPESVSPVRRERGLRTNPPVTQPIKPQPPSPSNANPGGGGPAIAPESAAPVGGASQRGVASVEDSLARLSFYPARLPVAVGSEAQLTVFLDPGLEGVSGPLHLAYDPVRLEVVKAEGGALPNGDGKSTTEVTHTPVLGWITIAWKGRAVGSGALAHLTVRPRESGDLAVLFAGPIGAVRSMPATVVAVPPAAMAPHGATQQ